MTLSKNHFQRNFTAVEMPVYQFTSHENLPEGSACPVHEMFQLYGKLQKGIKLTRGEKDYIAEMLSNNGYSPTYKVMGFAAPFAFVLPRILVMQWGTWREYYAPDKTSLRKALYGTIDEMVYLPNK